MPRIRRCECGYAFEGLVHTLCPNCGRVVDNVPAPPQQPIPFADLAPDSPTEVPLSASPVVAPLPLPSARRGQDRSEREEPLLAQVSKAILSVGLTIFLPAVIGALLTLALLFLIIKAGPAR